MTDKYFLPREKPWLTRFLKQTGLGINTFSMIRDKDTVLLGISGGKDSLVLALALALRRKWLPITYNLKAAIIIWKQYPWSEEQIKNVDDFLR